MSLPIIVNKARINLILRRIRKKLGKPLLKNPEKRDKENFKLIKDATTLHYLIRGRLDGNMFSRQPGVIAQLARNNKLTQASRLELDIVKAQLDVSKRTLDDRMNPKLLEREKQEHEVLAKYYQSLRNLDSKLRSGKITGEKYSDARVKLYRNAYLRNLTDLEMARFLGKSLEEYRRERHRDAQFVKKHPELFARTWSPGDW